MQVLSVNLQSKQMTLSMKGGFNYKKQDLGVEGLALGLQAAQSRSYPDM